MFRRCASAPEHSLYLDGRRRLRRLRLLRTAEDRDSEYRFVERTRHPFHTDVHFGSSLLSGPLRVVDGRHSGHADIRANDEMEWRGDVWNHEAMLRDSTLEGQAPMQAGTPTLGTVLRDAGYSTAMIGKWGVGGPATESTPGKMGFDTYFGCICQRQAHTYYPPFLWQNDRRFYLSNRLVAPGTPLDEGADRSTLTVTTSTRRRSTAPI